MAAAAVTLYTTQYCPFCIAAKRLLNSLDVTFNEIPVDADAARRQEMMKLSGQRTVPQIWVGDTHVGGCDELYSLHENGKLKPLLFPN